VHHFDVDDGFVSPATAAALVDGAEQPTAYVCGPTPFMDIVEHALLDGGVAAGQIHIERFTPGGPVIEPVDEPDPVAVSVGTRITIELDGRTESADHHPGTTILQTARSMGMSPPFSCEAGSCATCMARLEEGEAKMHVNNALTPEEVDGGWVLTCQAVPTSPTVHVVYGYD
jgi:ferredoxin